MSTKLRGPDLPPRTRVAGHPVKGGTVAVVRPTTIVSVRSAPLDISLKVPFGIASGAQLVAENVLVEVRLADGTVGLGEAAPFPAVSGETQSGTLSAL